MNKISLKDLNTMNTGPYRLGDGDGGIIGFLRFDNEVPYLGLDTVKLHILEIGD
jgi:hypothetical protein